MSSVLAIGNFDGVHLGHQALLQQAITTAREIQSTAIVLTFDPHPTRVLAPERVAPLLLTLSRKQELLLELGIDRVVVQRFDQDFSKKTPYAFVQDVIVPLKTEKIFVGTDFCFGSQRQGTIETLTQLGEEFGFTTHATPLTTLDGLPTSSSRVRRALAEGNLELVQTLLGRPFDFDGCVVKGNQRGRTIGFPTANLITQTEALPKSGVYAVRASWSEGGETLSANGMMNIGIRPTFEQGSPQQTIEVHLFDTNRDLYGKTLRVVCIQRLRDEQKFETIEALKAQLQRDEKTTRALF